jgi:hypothetical protein
MMQLAELDRALEQLPPRQRISRIAAAILAFDGDVLTQTSWLIGVVEAMARRLPADDRRAIAGLLDNVVSVLDRPEADRFVARSKARLAHLLNKTEGKRWLQ